MMFNKYLVVADSAVDIRDAKSLSKLMRHIDISRAVIRSEGVLDVLDHATATLGFGGKLALNATAETQRCSVEEPTYRPSAGIKVSDEWLREWSLLVLYIEPGVELSMEALIGELGVCNINFVAIFDVSASESMTGFDLAWLALANSDPRRDIAVSNGTMVVDARTKLPGRKGHPARFPNVVTSNIETIKSVDSRWASYGMGEFIPSPSLRYRELILSNKEDV